MHTVYYTMTLLCGAVVWIYINASRNLKNAKGKNTDWKLNSNDNTDCSRIHNSIAETTLSQSIWIVPFLYLSYSLPQIQIFLTSFFHNYIICHSKCDLKKESFFYFNEMRLTIEKKSTCIVCEFFFFFEITFAKKKYHFLRKIFFFVVWLLSFSENDDAFRFNWTKNLENHRTPHQNCTS